MDVGVVSTKREELPTCFGKEWDRNAPECAGGPDPDFCHPKTGLHVREQCNFFQSCGARVQATRHAQSIPVQNLVRQQQPAGPPQTFSDFLRGQQAMQIEAQRIAALNSGRPAAQMVPQQAAQHQGANYPAAIYQLNYQMPSYLTRPEDRMPGETLWPVLGREVIRSMFKAMGHAVSHFFDVRPFKEK